MERKHKSVLGRNRLGDPSVRAVNNTLKTTVGLGKKNEEEEKDEEDQF